METGKLEQHSRVLKLSTDIISLVARGKRDPADVANKLQAIIDSPAPGDCPEWMTAEQYRNEIAWWTDWLKKQSFSGDVTALAVAMTASLGMGEFRPDFPKPLQFSVPNILPRAQHAIFWRSVKGVKIVTPESYLKGRVGGYQSIDTNLEAIFASEFEDIPEHATDIALEVFDGVRDELCEQFRVQNRDADDRWLSPEGEMVLEIEESLHMTCYVAGVLHYRKGMVHEFDPLMAFWAEYGNYPLGFDDEGLLVVLCRDGEEPEGTTHKTSVGV